MQIQLQCGSEVTLSDGRVVRLSDNVEATDGVDIPPKEDHEPGIIDAVGEGSDDSPDQPEGKEKKKRK